MLGKMNEYLTKINTSRKEQKYYKIEIMDNESREITYYEHEMNKKVRERWKFVARCNTEVGNVILTHKKINDETVFEAPFASRAGV